MAMFSTQIAAEIVAAMRAANSLRGFDSRKHSGVIAFFNQTFLKEGLMDSSLSKIIQRTSYFREKSDYQDFFIASKSDAERQCEDAKLFVETVNDYLAQQES